MIISVYKHPFIYFFISLNKMKKEIKRFNLSELNEGKKDIGVTVKVNSESWKLFRRIMKEQNLIPSTVINQFIVLVNDLLVSEDGGEISFVFEPIK